MIRNQGDVSNSNISALNGAALINANGLLDSKPSGANFADKLKELRAEDQEKDILVQEILKGAKEGKSGAEVLKSLAADPQKMDLLKAMQKNLVKKQDQLKQQNNFLDQAKIAEVDEPAYKLKTSEHNLAEVAQLNQQVVTEAVQQSATHNPNQQGGSGGEKKAAMSGSRMAPKITEDVQNKAVRVDIPGLDDIKSLIVKVSGNGVAIQVAGSDEAMHLLNKGQNELKERLKKHDISLKSLQTVSAGKKVTALKAKKEREHV